ncbi:MAG: long-chain fatty acid--CoA ligase [Armatimonadota bacterium]|nr:long-chain fatty acid--CoA ligase [Armatimonadota bacterium]
MGPETLGQVFWDRVTRYGERPAQRVKQGGRWVDISWRALGEEVRELALGLLALGCGPGTAVGILARSRAEWVRADFAILSIGGVSVPIYPTYPEPEVAYIAQDAGVRVLVVEDPGQLAKVLGAADGLPGLEAVVLIDGERPIPFRERPELLTWEELRARGRARADELAPRLEAALRDTSPAATATIVYTSGTTGHPKGVVQTHANHLAVLPSAAEVMGLREGDVHLLFLPLAHSFARLQAFVGIYAGLVTAFAESLEQVGANLREVAPHFFCAVPRVFEKVHARILGEVAAASPLRRRIFSWALGVGRRVSRRRQERRAPPPLLRLQHALAHRLVFRKLHRALGGRLRFCVSGGAPLDPAIAEFFHAAGILILEGYGLTETCPILTANRPDRYRFGTVGVAFPGVELRIAEDGEILARGPNIARGYHRRPEETAEAFTPDGWFRTGDVGELDADGFLRITDRKKDLIKTAGGSYVAPQAVENLLKRDPLVSQALVYGDRRPYPVALLTLNPEEAERIARQAGVPPAGLADHPLVRERLERAVQAANAELPSYAQVKRFAVVPGDFTQEGGELTPTLKVRRRVVSERYQALLEALYQEPRPA